MWHKENRLQMAIVILVGFVSLILLAGLVLFIVFSASSSQRSRLVETKILESAPIITPDLVIDNYIKTLEELNTSLQTISDSAKVVERIASTLFEVRVPKELLDIHLSAALKVRGKENSPADSADAVAARTFIENLLEQARRLSRS